MPKRKTRRATKKQKPAQRNGGVPEVPLEGEAAKRQTRARLNKLRTLLENMNASFTPVAASSTESTPAFATTFSPLPSSSSSSSSSSFSSSSSSSSRSSSFTASSSAPSSKRKRTASVPVEHAAEAHDDATDEEGDDFSDVEWEDGTEAYLRTHQLDEVPVYTAALQVTPQTATPSDTQSSAATPSPYLNTSAHFVSTHRRELADLTVVREWIAAAGLSRPSSLKRARWLMTEVNEEQRLALLAQKLDEGVLSRADFAASVEKAAKSSVRTPAPKLTKEQKQLLELEHVVHFTAMYGLSHFDHVYASDPLLQALLLSQLPVRLQDPQQQISPRKHLTDVLAWLVALVSDRTRARNTLTADTQVVSTHMAVLRALRKLAAAQLTDQVGARSSRLASLYAATAAETPLCAVDGDRDCAVLTVALLRALGWHARLVAWITPLSVHANPNSTLSNRVTTKLKSSYFHRGPLLIDPPRRVALSARRVKSLSSARVTSSSIVSDSPSSSSSTSSGSSSGSSSSSSTSSGSSSTTSSSGSSASASASSASSSSSTSSGSSSTSGSSSSGSFTLSKTSSSTTTSTSPSPSSPVSFYYFVEVEEASLQPSQVNQLAEAPVYLTADPTSGTIVPERCWREAFGLEPVYVLAFEEAGVTDRTPAYCSRWSLVLRERGTHTEWLQALLERRCSTAAHRQDPRAAAERRHLKELCESEPLPTTVSAFKDHPLYVLERHLLKYETIHPRDTVGLFRGEEVFPRSAVYTLHSEEKWLQLNRQIRAGELPVKAVEARQFARNKRARSVSTSKSASSASSSAAAAASASTGKVTELFGAWQTEPYDPPSWTENGGVPRNRFGNVYLFFPSMCPKLCTHLPFSGALKIARQLGVDAAPAQTGWEFHRGRSHPLLVGAVVHRAQAQLVEEAHQQLLQAEYLARLRERTVRMHTLWKRLSRQLRRWHRLRARYVLPDQQSASASAPSPAEVVDPAQQASAPQSDLGSASLFLQVYRSKHMDTL